MFTGNFREFHWGEEEKTLTLFHQEKKKSLPEL